MALYFTSDTHFGDIGTILRENRPFNTSDEFDNYIINNFNEQTTHKDTIWHLGDFINYNSKDKESWKKAIYYVERIEAKVVLIIGNNEERLIQKNFDNNFKKFREYAIGLGFSDIRKDAIIEFNNKNFYLNHYPSKHKADYINLFGHTHRATGLWKPFGLNVGCDLNHFQLFSEMEIERLLDDKHMYWDTDKDNLSM